MDTFPLPTHFGELQCQVKLCFLSKAWERGHRKAGVHVVSWTSAKVAWAAIASLLVKLFKAEVRLSRAPPGHQDSVIQNVLDARGGQ